MGRISQTDLMETNRHVIIEDACGKNVSSLRLAGATVLYLIRRITFFAEL